MEKVMMRNKTAYIPYNNDLKLVKKIKDLNLEKNNIQVIFYFSPSPSLIGTGRRCPNFEKFVDKGEFSENLFEESLNEFLILCKNFGFGTNLLLNNVLLGLPFSNQDLVEKIPKIQKFLENLDKKDLISMITIGNPYLIELLNLEKLSNIKVKTSVNFQIKNHKSIDILNNLVKYYFPANLYEIELQKDLLRDIPSLKKIKKTLKSNIKLSILVNEGCLTGCPYQQAHQIHSCSFPTKELSKYDKEFNFGIARCKYIVASEPWRFIDSNWILPEQLVHYEGILDSIKLTGRNDDTETIVKTVKAYLLQEYDESNINALISLMKMEDWVFPKSLLPVDFDKVLFEDVDSEYFINIFNKIKEYNLNNNQNVNIKLKGFVKEKLYKYEGVL